MTSKGSWRLETGLHCSKDGLAMTRNEVLVALCLEAYAGELPFNQSFKCPHLSMRATRLLGSMVLLPIKLILIPCSLTEANSSSKICSISLSNAVTSNLDRFQLSIEKTKICRST